MIDKVYVTKYALTDGVRLCKVLEIDDDDDAHVVWLGGINGKAFFRLGKDAHATRADAENAFMNMRESAIRSAKRRLDKLAEMKFVVKE